MTHDDRRGSVSLAEPEFEPAEAIEEKNFLLAVERGDIITTRKEMAKAIREKHLNINCTDPLNRSALIIAIENEDSDLVFLLLNGGVKPKDALLHAIDEEYVEAVEILLEYEEELHKKCRQAIPYSWETIKAEFATWTPDVTPLILAGHKNNYEILKILLDRGAAIPIPHDIKCGCDLCVGLSHEDSLKYSKSRIHAYQALTSPCLISLSSKDPVLTAFELSFELRKLARMENEFKEEYEELRDKVQQFAVDLLDHARSSHELDVMLNYDPDSHFEDFEEEEDEYERKMGLERLKIAIECRQKKFVSHPHVQQLLASLWYMHLEGFRRQSIFGQFAGALKTAASFPIYSTAYLAVPNSKIGKMAKQPFIKFLCHSASFMFFLFLLVMVSQRVEKMMIKLLGTEAMIEKVREQERKERGGFPSYTELLIVWYVICYIWAELKSLWNDGVAAYVKDLWNFAEFTSNTLYLTWISLRIIAWYIVHRELSQGIDAYIPREQWHAFDPMLIAEAMFGAANIFSFLKLINIFLVSPQLGPLQISLGRMVFDIMKFFFFYTLVLFAYACGLNQILSYYADIDKNLCYSNEDPYAPNREQYEFSCDIWRRFVNLFETSQSLFWASFGLVDLANFDLTGVKEFTRFWTLLMFGCYSIMNVVVLLNLLIAMMSHSFAIVAERADVEWKFARTKLWMKYFEDGATVPPPFNIIPSVKSFQRLFFPKKTTVHHSTKILSVKKKEEKYRRVMRCLVRRYITASQKDNESKGISEDDVNEVKNEINNFRYTLIDMLLKNGFKGETPEMGGTVAGKKQLTRERLLMKGFNIDVAEDVQELGHHLRANRTKENMLSNIVMRATGKSVKKDWNKISKSKEESRDQIGKTDQYVKKRSSMRRGTKKKSSVTKDNISEISRQKAKIQRREAKLQRDQAQYKEASYWGRIAFMTKKGVFSGGSMRKDVMKDIIPYLRDSMKEKRDRDSTEWEGGSQWSREDDLKSYASLDIDSKSDDGLAESKIKQFGRGGTDRSISPLTPVPPEPAPEVGQPEPEVETSATEPEVEVSVTPPKSEEPVTAPEVEKSENTKQTSSNGLEIPASQAFDPSTLLNMDGPVTEFFEDFDGSTSLQASSSRQSPPFPPRIQPYQHRTSADLSEFASFSLLPKVSPFRRDQQVTSTKPSESSRIAFKPKIPVNRKIEGLRSKFTENGVFKEEKPESKPLPLNDLQPGSEEPQRSVSPVRSARQFFENQAKAESSNLRKSSATPTKFEVNYTQGNKRYTDTMTSTSSTGTAHFVSLPKTNPVFEHIGRNADGANELDYGPKPSRPQVIKMKKSSLPVNYQAWKPPDPKWRIDQQAEETSQKDGAEEVIQDGSQMPKELSREGTPVKMEADISLQIEETTSTKESSRAGSPSQVEEADDKAKKPLSLKKHRAPSPPQKQDKESHPPSPAPSPPQKDKESHPPSPAPSPPQKEDKGSHPPTPAPSPGWM